MTPDAYNVFLLPYAVCVSRLAPSPLVPVNHVQFKKCHKYSYIRFWYNSQNNWQLFFFFYIDATLTAWNDALVIFSSGLNHIWFTHEYFAQQDNTLGVNENNQNLCIHGNKGTCHLKQYRDHWCKMHPEVKLE